MSSQLMTNPLFSLPLTENGDAVVLDNSLCSDKSGLEAAGPARSDSRANQSHRPAGEEQLQEYPRRRSLHQDAPVIRSEAPGSPE